MYLLKAVEQERKEFIHRLINMGYKTFDGTPLDNLSHSELKAIYENISCREEAQSEPY